MDYGKFIGSCLLVVLLAAWEMASAQQPRRVLYATLGYKNLGLFIADGDGTHERALLRLDSSDYNGSFSADGKWIIFTSERNGSADIYRIHPDGTGMERLTDYKGFDDQGALSPDGSTLAFVSTRDGGFANIWLMDTATHRARVLAKAKGGSFRPNWSPDGKWIAFTSDRGTHTIRWHGGWEFLQSLAIYVVHPDGTSLHRLTPIDGYSGSPKWSADGRRILFYQSTPDDVYPGRTGTSRGPFAVSQIVSIDIESGAAKTYTSGPGLKVAPQFIGESVVYWNKLGPDKGLVLASGATVRGKMMAPSWSADGKMVVYDKKEVSSGEPKMTPAYSIDPKFHMDITSYFASWSPKGDEFVLAEKPGLVIVHARSESPTFSYPTSVLYDSKQVQSFPLAGVGAPAWSPDDSMIAFAVGAGANFGSHMNPARIAVIQPDGTGFRYLTSDKENAGYPSWSPDSKQIVYRVVGSEQGLRIVNLDDDRVTLLTDQADDFPGWSPRGDVIAFTSFRSGGFEIYSIHPDGSDVIRLTHDEGNDAHGSWSPDGEWYIFSSSRAGWKDEAMLCGGGDQPYAGLYAMHGDGTGVRQLTDDQWEDALPAVQPLTQVK
jgi:Tol biopolymer transport system component